MGNTQRFALQAVNSCCHFSLLRRMSGCFVRQVLHYAQIWLHTRFLSSTLSPISRTPPTAEEDDMLRESPLLAYNFILPQTATPRAPTIFRPPPTAEEDEMLRESLLSGGADLEAGQAASGSGAKKRQHSWISLVGIAAQYMWPDSFVLQVKRAAAAMETQSSLFAV